MAGKKGDKAQGNHIKNKNCGALQYKHTYKGCGLSHGEPITIMFGITGNINPFCTRWLILSIAMFELVNYKKHANQNGAARRNNGKNEILK